MQCQGTTAQTNGPCETLDDYRDNSGIYFIGVGTGGGGGGGGGARGAMAPPLFQG